MPAIPLHSIAFCRQEQLVQFPNHERLSYAGIAYDLVGAAASDLHAVVVAEMRHRVGLKLSLGQRVAIATDELSRAERHDLANLANNQGAPVIEVAETSSLAQRPPVDPMMLRRTWKGITLVGDVHGDLASFQRALRWAEGRQHFVWLLGDVIDYGADTLATAELAYRAVMAGTAAMLLGNHERKIARWLDQNGKLRINQGNRVTIDALNKLGALERKQWIGRFRSLLAHSALMQQIDQMILVHAAIHPSLWSDPMPTAIEQYALYGEADMSNGSFRRVHRWIDAVPVGTTVFVGHDTVAQFPIIVTGAKGGQVVFLDTGCGTGGYLSTADLRFTEHGLRLECFNRQ